MMLDEVEDAKQTESSVAASEAGEGVGKLKVEMN